MRSHEVQHSERDKKIMRGRTIAVELDIGDVELPDRSRPEYVQIVVDGKHVATFKLPRADV